MNRVALLREAAELLAAEPDIQLKHLEKIRAGQNLDELALEYDAIAAAARDMLLCGEITSTQCAAVGALNDLLTRMSEANNQRLWTTEALRSAPEWREVRKVATVLLNDLSTR